MQDWVRIHENEVVVAGKVRAVCKWVLDFLRNLMIVGILQYFARRSDRFVLSLIANIGLLALVGYTISFLHVFSLNLFSRRGIVWIVVDAVVYVVTFGLLLFGISFGIFAAINEIMLFQER